MAAPRGRPSSPDVIIIAGVRRPVPSRVYVRSAGARIRFQPAGLILQIIDFLIDFSIDFLFDLISILFRFCFIRIFSSVSF